MRAIINFLYCLLALAGCMDRPGTTLLARSSAGGVDTLFSRTEIDAGRAHFQCLRSASGRCHYALFASQCTTTTTAAGAVGTQCTTRDLDTFALAVGQRRDLSGLPDDFRQCVSHRAGPMGADCTPVPRTPAALPRAAR